MWVYWAASETIGREAGRALMRPKAPLAHVEGLQKWKSSMIFNDLRVFESCGSLRPHTANRRNAMGYSIERVAGRRAVRVRRLAYQCNAGRFVGVQVDLLGWQITVEHRVGA
jgi:hypothetical protein